MPSYYQPGTERAAKVQRLFNTIAPRYDLINDLQSFGLHRFWKRRMVQLAGIQPGQKALDVCCGTGDLAFALAKAGAQVVGLDFSEAMLAVAKKRSTSGNPQFQQGDAMNLPFANDTFDLVTIGYGLRNLASWERGLEELRRVTKPGGRILVLDFGKPDNGLWRACYFGYLRLCVPVFGKIFCSDTAAYAYILESLKHYPAQRGVEQKMRDLQCRDIRVHNFVGGAMSINEALK
jgi:demethylmenaquinone methyltransferase / 2-methoxy-6-polyprenyl-1,4-benzoquinol methylase